MDGPDYYVPAAALGSAFLVRLPSLVHGWRDPMVRCVSALIFMAAAGFAFAAPPTITQVNALSGVPNISAPLVYGILLAFSCASLALIIHWRGGPAEERRRQVRSWITGYAGLIAMLAVLFALGDAPEERLRDLDTHYANTPFIREMIVLYLVGHTVSAIVVTTMCWRWSRQVSLRYLRLGLVTLVFGFLLNLGFGIAKLAAVSARWSGRDLDVWSTSIAPPLASAGAVITTLGFLLPLIGPRAAARWDSWRRYRDLGHLWRPLNTALGRTVVLLKVPLRSGIEMHSTLRETQISDYLRALAPLFDPDVHEQARLQALSEGRSHSDAAVAAAAAVIADALKRHSQVVAPDPERSPDLSTVLGPGLRLDAVGREFATARALTASESPS